MRPFPLIGLLFAATPAIAAPIAGGPIVKDGVEITILSVGPPAGGPGGVVEVILDAEARSDAAADKLKFRSLRGVTAVDCRLGANRFIKADAYPEADLRGQVAPRVVSGDWVKPADSSFMSGVTARVCGGAPAQTAAGPLPVVTLGAQPAAAASPPPPSAAPARLAVATSPRPVAAAPAPPAFRAKLGGLGVAQVAASPTAQGAQHVLDRLRPLIVPPLTSSIDSATVNNAAVFRASVTGFVSLGDAQAFCARAASVSKTCWVHRKAADTAPPPTHHP